MSFETPGLIEKKHNSEKFHSISVDIGGTPMTFETGRIAKQTGCSVWVRWGDSVVLTTVCDGAPRAGLDFFPLTCEYVEKTYAAGKIPGGFFKREARPRDHEVLNARITDRSIRPLFPEGFRNEVQVINTVVSHDGVHDTDILALCGASMALHCSSLPWAEETGPIAGVRVARLDGKLVVNPTLDELDRGDLNVMVAMSKDAIMMVEGGGEETSESDLIDALFFAHAEGQKIIAAVNQMREVMGREKMVFTPPTVDQALFDDVVKMSEVVGLRDALATRNKIERYAALDACKANLMAKFEEKLGDGFDAKKKDISAYFGDVKYKVMRTDVITKKERLDGRKYDAIRNIDSEIGVLPRTHGSALFTRGETQALVTATLGTSDDEQKIETLVG